MLTPRLNPESTRTPILTSLDPDRFSTSQICDKHDKEYYAKFKKWADDYFLIKHRGEVSQIDTSTELVGGYGSIDGWIDKD